MSEEDKSQETTEAKSFIMISMPGFEDLMKILGKTNKVVRVDRFDLPQLVETYYDVNKLETAGELSNVLLEIERSENWRVRRFGQSPRLVVDEKNKAISFIDQTTNTVISLRDTKGYIIIADLQMVFIVPGEESIKSGQFRPNEVIRLTTLLLETTLFCKLKNLPILDEEGNVIEGKHRVGFELYPVAKPSNS